MNFKISNSLATVIVLFSVSSALAESNRLKEIKVISQDKVEFVFENKVPTEQLKAEYFRDVVQLSLNDTTIFPAKIVSVGEDSFLKVFAYQYTPKLVRCRLTTKGESQGYKDRLKIEGDGKHVFVSLVEEKSVTREASKIVKDTIGIQSAYAEAAAPNTVATTHVDKSEKKSDIQPVKLTGGKSYGSPTRTAMALIFVLSLFFVAVFALRKAKKGKGLGSLLKKKDGKMIDLVASYSLGPKKSIAVVKIKNQLLVVGISDESINLITRLNHEGEIDQIESEIEADPTITGDMSASLFSGLLGKASQKAGPSLKKATYEPKVLKGGPRFEFEADEDLNIGSPVRDRIRDRLKGMKSI
jgi:flagellar protein FliO/FliZ